MSRRSKRPSVTTVTHGLELLFDHRTRLRKRPVEGARWWGVSFVDRRGNVLHVAHFLTETAARAFVDRLTRRAAERRARRKRN